MVFYIITLFFFIKLVLHIKDLPHMQINTNVGKQTYFNPTLKTHLWDDETILNFFSDKIQNISHCKQ